jgi:hypothetical protein
MHRELNTYVIELQTSWRQSVSCEIEPVADAPRIYTLRAPKSILRIVERQTQGVTYVPGLICHPCSRPHGEVSRRSEWSHSILVSCMHDGVDISSNLGSSRFS